jgi:sugar phosphate isomerase/epimerase
MMDRREFVKRISMVSLAAVTGMTRPLLASSARVAEYYGGNYTVSLNCYSFNALLSGASPAMTLADAIDFCTVHKFDAIDPQGYYFPGYPAVPSDSYIYQIKTKARTSGIVITGTGVNDNFASTSATGRAADVQIVKNWIVVASKLGAPAIRVFSGTTPAGYEQKWGEVAVWVADSIRQCADFGKQYGVKVVVQNHADFLKTADQIIALVKLVNSDNFGVLLDTGSFVTTDLFGELTKSLPYATNFLLKQNVQKDIVKVIGLARTSGFKGALLIEALSGDPLVTVPQFLSDVRGAIAASQTAVTQPASTVPHDSFRVIAGPAGRIRVACVIPQSGVFSYKLFDAQGRRAADLGSFRLTTGPNDVDLDVRNFASGHYVLTIFSGTRQVCSLPLPLPCR